MRTLASTLLLSFLGFLASCGGGGGNGGQGMAQYFQSAVFQATQLQSYSNVEFSRRPNAGGVQFTSDVRKAGELASGGELSLLMDIWVPPNATSATPMPLVVFVHGGGFKMGGKEEDYIVGDATSYARSGFVTASINYRLTPDNTATPELRRAAITQAADDLMNAVRFLKKNAATYHIDTSRVAIVGTSAGGALALVDAVEADTLAGTTVDSAYTGISAAVQAVVSTGATLVDQYTDTSGLLHYDASDAPVLMFHAKPTDSTTTATWDGNVVPTCNSINASHNSCTAIAQPNMTHTVSMNLFDKWWPTIQPFLWQQLLLGSL
jgi:acetyl esterase/lipase